MSYQPLESRRWGFDPSRTMSVSGIAEMLRTKGEYILPEHESPKKFKRRLRDEYGMKVKSERVRSGYRLTLVVPQPKQERRRDQAVQGIIPSKGQSLEEGLMIVLRRGTTFVPDKHRSAFNHLKRQYVGLEFDEVRFGNGANVTLIKS